MASNAAADAAAAAAGPAASAGAPESTASCGRGCWALPPPRVPLPPIFSAPKGWDEEDGEPGRRAVPTRPASEKPPPPIMPPVVPLRPPEDSALAAAPLPFARGDPPSSAPPAGAGKSAAARAGREAAGCGKKGGKRRDRSATEGGESQARRPEARAAPAEEEAAQRPLIRSTERKPDRKLTTVLEAAGLGHLQRTTPLQRHFRLDELRRLLQREGRHGFSKALKAAGVAKSAERRALADAISDL